ncbi:Non-specific serine/threonine protein kinase [Heracleum sosnowskyi]|uniref:non-specific serine/threonine protein kinase n=1 Tax=Heracleum sosnowskyi TaxID=360622 RepID=A0AAD8N455_9APIA|nr:Non-specific serine/threonine protein kinase [Heracleum sosnowskyi]
MNRNSGSIKRTSSSSGSSGGIILEKYQLGQILGRGSFAKVYRAQSLANNSSVAIKVIEKPATSDPTMENLLVREVAAMRKLNDHPNILNLHEVMATKSKIYLVMEIAEGGELFSQLTRRGKMNEGVARKYFQELISALRFCHANGVAHRDLKPQNLLLDKYGTLKVSDFGLSALPEQAKNGLLYTACGTPAYTAPEVVRRNGYDGAKADAFSCGVILFVFLAGYLPFDDANLANMYKKIYKREIVFPSWISKGARNVIYKLLDPNPNTRMTMEGLMSTSWFSKSLKVETEVDKLGILLGKDCKNGSVNAFDIIMMSSGLDLSGLFEADLSKKERRFTSRGSMKEIEERVERVSEELGYKMEKGKGREMGLVKGKMILLVRILELVTKMGLLMVEMEVISDGDEVHKGRDELEAFKAGLGDIALSWHNNDVVVNG